MLSIKRSSTIIVVILLATGLGMFGAHNILGNKEDLTRKPMVAGTFYPDDPAQLRFMVDGLLAETSPQNLEGSIFALVAPHAGYIYSARIAAHSYAQIKGHKYKRVVIIAPSHVEPLSFTSIYSGDAYTTPLGQIPVDKDFAKKLAQKDSTSKLSNAGHGCHMGRCEHAIEVQLPFLQESLQDLKIVPVIMGAANYQASRSLGVALSELIQRESATQEPDTLIVASSDLSHFHTHDEAVSLDHKALGAIEGNDYLSLSMNIELGAWEACGGAPIIAAMIATERMGATGRKILAYANSGDVTGDKTSVVGYGAAALFQEKKPEEIKQMSFSLEEKDKKTLLALAKKSVETSVRDNKLTPLPDNLSKPLQTPFGAFVTLKKNGKLRGCVGFLTPDKSLAETVREVASLAALRDTRFSPVKADELNKLEYEISVLSPFRRMSDLQDIQIGRDGLLILNDRKRGLLLPQVPVEYGWDVPQFIEETAIKAGLSPRAWKDKDTDLFAFSAFVF
ncbi:MAG: AmmeMemoRadiSam system protein B [Alphaproteobacteria bacterium]|nr:AmmeMemoRadiSam system protein B [Alphaproteobacteria bacterium]